MGLKYFIKTLGCQMNKFDSAEFARFFAELGMSEASSSLEADLVHVNTCSVRQKAEDKFFSFLGEMREMKERRPGVVIGVSGCVPELCDVAKRNKCVDYVAGSRAPAEYFDLIKKTIERKHLLQADEYSDDFAAGDEGKPRVYSSGADEEEPATTSRASAFLTIIRGCSNNCAYCVVPRARGPERSRSIAEITDDAKRLIGGGAAEIILLGQNALAYGEDLSPRLSLIDAIEAVHDLAGMKRLRFVTSHPKWVSAEFLKALKSFPKVCEHFHIPCQAGDDEILRRMNRRYTSAEYAEKIAMIREYFPTAGITADVIVGFPGETEEQFLNTLELMRKVVVTSAYMFKYSPRPRTVAEQMGDDIPNPVKVDRLRRLIELQREISVRLNRALIESDIEVMVDMVVSDERFKGRSRCNRIVDFTAPSPLSAGDIVQVRITSATPHALIGTLK